ncbi:MAG: tetratricopeptide repeat protein [Steroidobacteraceae bacterium]
MSGYSVRDVERVLRLSRSTLRGLINSGFVTPARGPRREFRFSFQDLIVLRAARALIDADVPRRRINRSLDELRRSLPDTLPLSGLSISAIGDRVVVREGNAHWQADDGQYVLGLDVKMEEGLLRMIEHKSIPTPVPPAISDWFDRALELESTDTTAAIHAYEQAVRADTSNVAAWINWGRLLHEQGDIKEAERIYRGALAECGTDPVLMFNLAVLLEDSGRTEAAIDAYHTAIETDPLLADGHYNLARLYEAVGKPQHAIRHFGQYRRLMLSNQH